MRHKSYNTVGEWFEDYKSNFLKPMWPAWFYGVFLIGLLWGNRFGTHPSELPLHEFVAASLWMPVLLFSFWRAAK